MNRILVLTINPEKLLLVKFLFCAPVEKRVLLLFENQNLLTKMPESIPLRAALGIKVKNTILAKLRFRSAYDLMFKSLSPKVGRGRLVQE